MTLVCEDGQQTEAHKIILAAFRMSQDPFSDKIKSKRMFHIPKEYEFVLENSAKSSAAICAKHSIEWYFAPFILEA